MDDLISRREAIDALRECQTYLFNEQDPDKKISLKSAEYAIEDLPSAQPEIIRCKDCMYWDKSWANDWGKDYHYCIMVDSVRKGDFYCADAERRTDETD